MTFDGWTDLISELASGTEYQFLFRIKKYELLDFSFANSCHICAHGKAQSKNHTLTILLTFYCSQGPPKIIQGDSTETKWLLDHGYHASPSLVRSPTFQRQSAIYQKRSYNGMKKLESFQSHRLFSTINRTANQVISDQYSRLS